MHEALGVNPESISMIFIEFIYYNFRSNWEGLTAETLIRSQLDVLLSLGNRGGLLSLWNPSEYTRHMESRKSHRTSDLKARTFRSVTESFAPSWNLFLRLLLFSLQSGPSLSPDMGAGFTHSDLSCPLMYAFKCTSWGLYHHREGPWYHSDFSSLSFQSEYSFNSRLV